MTPGIPAAAILVALDHQTKKNSAFPVETKGSNLRGQAENVARWLNYVDRLDIVADPEPTMLDLLQKIALVRQHLDFTHGRPGDKDAQLK